SFHGHTLAEPWEIATGQGDPYKVYTPFWKALSARGVDEALPAPKALGAPGTWPGSEDLAAWRLGAAMNRGAPALARCAAAGEEAARKRLESLLKSKVEGYREDRDFPALEAVSGLSEILTYGEIGPRRIWHAALPLAGDGATHFRKELVWRDFAHNLMFHFP